MINEVLNPPAVDVPRILFGDLASRTVHAKIVCTQSGILAGVEALESGAKVLGLRTAIQAPSGTRVIPGSIVAVVLGNPLQIVRGEDALLGIISKVSGVATAAHAAVRRAGRIRVVCGGWKKMPATLKHELRDALKVGGLDSRIAPGPFLYLDKNYVRIFGSIAGALNAAGRLPGRTVCIQIRGETAPVAEEAIVAAKGGARVVMVDTGRVEDLREVSAALVRLGLRKQTEIAFAGSIALNDLERLRDEDVDIVDVGRAILDAPLLDFRYDVFDIGVGNNGLSPAWQD